MIKTFLTGRLTRDAELRELEGNKKVLNYSVATDIGFGDKKTTLFIDCSQWGEKLSVVEFLKKGTQVAVVGEPGLRTYQKNDGTTGASLTLRVDKVELLGSKVNTANTGSGTGEGVGSTTASDIAEPEENLPF